MSRPGRRPGERQAPTVGPWLLTPAEARTLDVLAVQRLSKKAAPVLGVSEGTVDYHVSNARKRMGDRIGNRLTRFMVLRMWSEFRGRICPTHVGPH